MSAWSEYQCGAITFEDYKFECLKEAMLDELPDILTEEEEEE